MRHWHSIYGAVVCARCHPPADAALVAAKTRHDAAPASWRRTASAPPAAGATEERTL